MSGESSIMRNRRKNNLPMKHYKQKWIGLFCGGFPREGEERETFFKISRAIF